MSAFARQLGGFDRSAAMAFRTANNLHAELGKPWQSQPSHTSSERLLARKAYEWRAAYASLMSIAL